MSLDIDLIQDGGIVFEWNITHNLGWMAKRAGIYYHLWRPEEIGISKAKELIEPLSDGWLKLIKYPKFYKDFNAPNGWGNYYNLERFVRKYLAHCACYPNATIEISR